MERQAYAELFASGREAATRVLAPAGTDAAVAAKLRGFTRMLLSTALSDGTGLDMGNALEWCGWLLGGGDPRVILPPLLETLGAHASSCGAVWKRGATAFKCNTCQADPTCAICVPCFKNGNHQGHDYTMIRTSGGCCDCGDPEAWKPEGFCSRHRGPDENADPAEAVPAEVHRRASLVFESVCYALMNAMGLGEGTPLDVVLEKPDAPRVAAMCEWLLGFVQSGDAFKRLVANALVLLRLEDGEAASSGLAVMMRRNNNLARPVREAVSRMYYALLSDLVFKKEFTIHFIRLYPTVSVDTTAAAANDDDSLLDSFSVQLFTVSSLMPRMVEQHALLDTIISTFASLLMSANKAESPYPIVDVTNQSFFRLRHYFRPVNDFKFVVTHPQVAQYMLFRKPDVFSAWINALVIMQGMSATVRERHVHVPQESDDWRHAFLLEWEILSSMPLLARGVRVGLKTLTDTMSEEEALTPDLPTDEATMAAIKNLLQICADVLEKRDAQVGSKGVPLPMFSAVVREIAQFAVSTHPVSVHWPIHRIFCELVHTAARHCHLTLDQIMPTMNPEFFVRFAEAPLRCQVLAAQELAGMWRRNGFMLQHEALFYRSANCGHMYDLDIMGLQFSSIGLGPDYALAFYLTRFELLDWLKLTRSKPNVARDSRDMFELHVMEEFLTLVVRIVSDRTRIGLSDEEMLERELVHQLMVKDQGHSKLAQAVIGFEASSNAMNDILHKVAEFRTPQDMKQGQFVLRDAYWDKFDPYWLHFNKRLRQQAEERFIGRQKKKHTGEESAANPLPLTPASFLEPPTATFPAFQQVVDMVHSHLLHRVLYVVMYNAAHGAEYERFSENLILCCLKLIMVALLTVDDSRHVREVPKPIDKATSPSGVREVVYETNDIRVNMCKAVVCPRKSEPGFTSLVGLLCTLLKDKSLGLLHSTLHVVLDTLAKTTPAAKEFVDKAKREIAPEIFHQRSASGASSDGANSPLDSKAAIKRRQAEIMARFQRQQSQFAQQHAEEEAAGGGDAADMASSDAGLGDGAAEANAGHANSHNEMTCCLCHEAANGKPMGAISLLQLTGLVRRARTQALDREKEQQQQQEQQEHQEQQQQQQQQQQGAPENPANGTNGADGAAGGSGTATAATAVAAAGAAGSSSDAPMDTHTSPTQAALRRASGNDTGAAASGSSSLEPRRGREPRLSIASVGSLGGHSTGGNGSEPRLSTDGEEPPRVAMVPGLAPGTRGPNAGNNNNNNNTINSNGNGGGADDEDHHDDDDALDQSGADLHGMAVDSDENDANMEVDVNDVMHMIMNQVQGHMDDNDGEEMLEFAVDDDGALMEPAAFDGAFGFDDDEDGDHDDDDDDDDDDYEEGSFSFGNSDDEVDPTMATFEEAMHRIAGLDGPDGEDGGGNQDGDDDDTRATQNEIRRALAGGPMANMREHVGREMADMLRMLLRNGPTGDNAAGTDGASSAHASPERLNFARDDEAALTLLGQERTNASDAVFAQSCGHHMHMSCFERYMRTMLNNERMNRIFQNAIDVRREEFTCPLCRRPGNAVMPIFTGDIQPTNPSNSNSNSNNDSSNSPSSMAEDTSPASSSNTANARSSLAATAAAASPSPGVPHESGSASASPMPPSQGGSQAGDSPAADPNDVGLQQVRGFVLKKAPGEMLPLESLNNAMIASMRRFGQVVDGMTAAGPNKAGANVTLTEQINMLTTTLTSVELATRRFLGESVLHSVPIAKRQYLQMLATTVLHMSAVQRHAKFVRPYLSLVQRLLGRSAARSKRRTASTESSPAGKQQQASSSSRSSRPSTPQQQQQQQDQPTPPMDASTKSASSAATAAAAAAATTSMAASPSNASGSSPLHAMSTSMDSADGDRHGARNRSMSGSGSSTPLLKMDMFDVLMRIVVLHPDVAQYAVPAKRFLLLEHIRSLIVLVLRAVITQALVQLTWQIPMPKCFGERTFGAYLLSVMAKATKQRKRARENVAVDPDKVTFIQAELVSAIHKLCLPFLRQTALFVDACGGIPELRDVYEELSESDECAFLCEVLQLPSIAELLDDHMDDSSRGLRDVVKAWVNDFVDAHLTQPAPRPLLSSVPFRFIPLPHAYENLFQDLAGRKCSSCKREPESPALCLVCGDLVCAFSACCRRELEGECTYHARMCCGGTGVFLLVKSAIVLLIRQRRRTFWGSQYLDDHGEEDLELRRGKPLYLSTFRQACLEGLFLDHAMDHDAHILKYTAVYHGQQL